MSKKQKTIKKQRLSVSITNFGKFYKAKLNDQPITENQLFTLIGIKSLSGYSLEKHVNLFEEQNKDTFEVESWPMDVS